MSIGFNFGSNTSTPAPTFGTGSITFGTPATQTQPTFGFGSTSTSTPQQGFQLGAPAAQVQPSFNFGSNTTPASTGLFGTTQTTGLFGTTTTASTGIPFGTPASAAPSTGLFGTSQALTFGNAPTSQPLGTASAVNLSFGLGGGAATSQPASTSTAVGLGGVATTQSRQVTQKEVPPKEQPLPNEIFLTVEQFKENVKKQKLYSSEIARSSPREFLNVEKEIELIRKGINEIESEMEINRQKAEKLKYDMAECLQNIEMAQRTQDIPLGLQYENTAPLDFFKNLLDRFEREVQTLKSQIESTYKYIKQSKYDIDTSEDLIEAMNMVHQILIASAGKMEATHNEIEYLKEEHLRKFPDDQKYFDDGKDEKNILKFDIPTLPTRQKITTGPTPFSNLAWGNESIYLLQQNPALYADQQAANSTQMGFGNRSFGIGQPSTGLFGTSAFGQNSSNFQLQKPPTGNKRGKQ